tara:strand:- start:6723 stop:6944 length:222 start_codon:yes stop_codon:yes gene_type:complete
MNKDSKEYKLGQQLHRDGLRYTQVPKACGGTVLGDVWCGFDEEAKASRCGFLRMAWNKSYGYQTSADLSTFFN